MRYLIVIAALFVIVDCASARPRCKDATGRTVTVPDRVERLMASGPTAAVVLYVLAPEKMIGWPSAPRPNEREFILPAARDLPEFGRLTGRGDTANVEVVLKAKPDLIFDFGSVSPTFVSLAERVQQQTGIPYLLFSGRLDQTAASLRALGGAFGVTERAEAIARYVEETDRLIDERLKDLPASARKRVYLARQPNGLETGLTGSINTEIIERAGGINVAERASRPRRHRQCVDRAGARLGARHDHHLGREFLRPRERRPGLGRGSGGRQQARVPGAAPAVRLDRRAALDQPHHRAALDRGAALSGALSRGHPRRPRATSSSCSTRPTSPTRSSTASWPARSPAAGAADAAVRSSRCCWLRSAAALAAGARGRAVSAARRRRRRARSRGCSDCPMAR